MDRGAWWATVYGAAELDTAKQLTYTHIGERVGEGEIYGESKMKLTLPYIN